MSKHRTLEDRLERVTVAIPRDERDRQILYAYAQGASMASPHVAGVAALLLDRIVTEAQRRGLRRLSLETGRGPAFEPALTLYRARGFTDGEAFSGYRENAFSQFLHLDMRSGQS